MGARKGSWNRGGRGHGLYGGKNPGGLETPVQSRDSGFLQGAAVLTAATMLVKVIGMFYKVPLGNILGGTGMSHFQTAYSIFSPVYALSIAGFPAAVSKLVSESAARGQRGNVRRILRVALLLLAGLGLGGSALLYLGAGPLTALVGNPGARLAVMAMAPSIFFCCLMAAWRGYYQGLGKMGPTAVSQVLEAMVKLVCGVLLAAYLLALGMRQHDVTGRVFGVPAVTRAEAELLTLPYAAAGALLGVSASALAGCLYLAIRHSLRGDGLPREHGGARARPAGAIVRDLLAIAFPICLASLISHMTNLVDVVTVMRRVGAAMERDGGAVLAMYQGMLPEGLEASEVPSFLYGVYGYGVNIFNLVPSLTISFGISALPLVASCWAVGDRRRAEEQIRSVVKLTALVAIPAGLGIAVLAGPILSLLYPARPQEVAIAAPILRTLGWGAVLVGITTPINSVFQAMGKAAVPVKLMGLGAVVKVAANYLLAARPALNIQGVAWGTLLSYAVILACSLLALRRGAGIRIPLVQTLLKPFVCGIICAAAAHTFYGFLSRWTDSRAIVLISIVIGMVFYTVFVLFFRILSKNEALMLPKGKKVANILEKLSFLG